MNFDATLLMTGMIFSSIGMGYFMYGKNSSQIIPKLSGGILMVYPYFVPNIIPLVMIGIALMVIPFFIKLDF